MLTAVDGWVGLGGEVREGGRDDNQVIKFSYLKVNGSLRPAFNSKKFPYHSSKHKIEAKKIT